MRLLLTWALAATACGCLSNGSSDEPDPQPGNDAGTNATPGGPGPLRIVSWNAWNFFDSTLGNCDNCPYEESLSASEYQQKVAGVAEGLAMLDGDVVVLQEVENDGVIDDVAGSPVLQGHGYDYHYLIHGNDPRGINIGLMSRYVIDQVISHKDDQFTRIDAPKYVYKYARDAVEFHMRWGTHHVAIVGVHFKARSSDEDPDRRIAEGQHTREIADAILAQDPNTRLFIVGDFNDTPDSGTYQSVRDGQSGPTYENAMAAVATADRWSYHYGAQKLLIDHLFAAPTVSEMLDDTTARIVHDDDLPSDHSPIGATYVIP